MSGYLTPPAKAPPAEAVVPAPFEAPASPVSKAIPPKADSLPMSFHWDEEMKLLLYVAISVSVVAAVVAGLVLYQG